MVKKKGQYLYRSAGLRGSNRLRITLGRTVLRSGSLAVIVPPSKYQYLIGNIRYVSMTTTCTNVPYLPDQTIAVFIQRV